MNANELRVGNIVNKKFTDSKELQWSYFRVEEFMENEKYPEFFQPIPLTEEWLKRFGFENNELFARHNKLVWFGDHIGIRGMLGMVKPVECKSVHQLQNLYFSLTGQELVVSEAMKTLTKD